MAEKEAPMILRLLTPTGVAEEASCDSVRLPQRDGADGQDGGFVGVQRDHVPAVIALGEGEVRASLAGQAVFRARVEGGFASVRDNVITVITDSAASVEPSDKET